MKRVGKITENEIDFDRTFNADEVPGNLAILKRKQISKKDENVQIRAPPITGHNKYRDYTLIPYMNYATISFATLIFRVKYTTI